MSALGRFTQGSHITYYSLMFFIAYAFKGQVHVFAGLDKIVSYSSYRSKQTLPQKMYCLSENLFIIKFFSNSVNKPFFKIIESCTLNN